MAEWNPDNFGPGVPALPSPLELELGELRRRVEILELSLDDIADAVMAVQRTLGVMPQALHETVADRIRALEMRRPTWK